MNLFALSELTRLSDTALFDLHEYLHALEDGDKCEGKGFIAWYHGEIVKEMGGKGLSHSEYKQAPMRLVAPIDYELVTQATDNHAHTAMLDSSGNGFTDPIDNHFHVVQRGAVQPSNGHVHLLGLPDELAVEGKVSSDPFAKGVKHAIEKMFLSGWNMSVAGGKVEEAAGHEHLVIIFNTEEGFGHTNFINGHTHWVLNWNVQEVDGHTHGIDAEELVEMSQMFAPIEHLMEEAAEEGKIVSDSELQQTDTGKTVDIEFGRYSSVNLKTDSVFSAEEAWELWGSRKKMILVTPKLSGYPLQAHIYVDPEGTSVQLFLGDSREVTNDFKKIRDALRFINYEQRDRIVLSGTVTTKFDRDKAKQVLSDVIRGKTKDDLAVFYVEDCWFHNGPLVNWMAEERRSIVEQFLAGSTLPVLKQMQRALTTTREKTLRVTEHAMSADGAYGVLWRDAPASIQSNPTEIAIYGEKPE